MIKKARLLPADFKQSASDVLEIEAQAILALSSRIDDDFVAACECLLNCEGRIIVTGMGKSGHIGSKIAATLASTGSPAFFVHPAEASHGDLGMITAHDTVLALSNSGETEEIIRILPLIKRLAVPLVALTGNPSSSLAQASSAHINVSVAQEACPLGLAPTASTTAALAMGDALAVALLQARGFTSNDFARSHPGGRLGRRLLLRVEDIMHSGAEIPRIGVQDNVQRALLEMTRKSLGITVIADDNEHVIGVFTDGDLARALEQQIDIHRARITDLMTTPCRTIKADVLAAEALFLMQNQKINAFPVVDANDVLIGAFNMHDLLRAGVV